MTTTSLSVFQPVAGDPAALGRLLSAEPGRWLPDARRTGHDRWTFTVHAGRFRRSVEGRLGQAWWAQRTLWVALSWQPRSSGPEPGRTGRLLPAFDGELGLHTGGPSASLVLDARYQPPGGQLGAALDHVALHRVARGTAQWLLADVAANLVAALTAEEAPAPAEGRVTGR
jgi:hypothetical protein